MRTHGSWVGTGWSRLTVENGPRGSGGVDRRRRADRAGEGGAGAGRPERRFGLPIIEAIGPSTRGPGRGRTRRRRRRRAGEMQRPGFGWCGPARRGPAGHPPPRYSLRGVRRAVRRGVVQCAGGASRIHALCATLRPEFNNRSSIDIGRPNRQPVRWSRVTSAAGRPATATVGPPPPAQSAAGPRVDGDQPIAGRRRPASAWRMARVAPAVFIAVDARKAVPRRAGRNDFLVC